MGISQKLSIQDVFSALGGTAALARSLGVGSSTVSEMKRRGRIPAEYWRDLLRTARATGHWEITPDLLVELHAREQAGVQQGFAEEGAAYSHSEAPPSTAATPAREQGHFSRHKHLRRSHFGSAEEIEDHIRALRDEWSHR
jgi:DNA-binding transcriptional regulator YdaS (Cro superfamily)